MRAMQRAGWAVALGAACLAGCAREDPPTPDPVVASGFGVEVRQSAFAEEYARFASLAPVSDGLEARRSYARLMLERAFIAAVADSAGLAERPEVAAHVERRRRFAMRRAWLRDTLEARIAEPTEADVREAFRRQNTRVRVRQIYAPTEAAARAFLARVRRGEPFADVARASMLAAGLPDATGDMGWVTRGDLDEGPENALFALARGEVSEPVASLRGWHVFEALDVEQTVRIDATAFASARERLAFEVRHRRVEEAGARFVRPLLEAHTLAVRPEALRAVWPQLAPLVPGRGDAQALAEMRESVPMLQPEGFSRDAPVAFVDGRPFTVAMLLDELPDIPLELWAPDLRTATEAAVRNHLLTARARAAGAADLPEVAAAVAEARGTALYYAGLRAAADTLRAERHVGRFYDLWRASFARSVTTTFTVASFPTREAARDALRRARAGDGAALASGAAAERRHTAAPGEPGPFGVHRLPLAAGGRRALSGPFEDGGRFALVEATARRTAYAPLAEARADVLAAMAAEPRAVVHQLLLDRGFRADGVVLHDDALRAALPMAQAPPAGAAPTAAVGR